MIFSRLSFPDWLGWKEKLEFLRRIITSIVQQDLTLLIWYFSLTGKLFTFGPYWIHLISNEHSKSDWCTDVTIDVKLAQRIRKIRQKSHRNDFSPVQTTPSHTKFDSASNGYGFIAGKMIEKLQHGFFSTHIITHKRIEVKFSNRFSLNETITIRWRTKVCIAWIPRSLRPGRFWSVKFAFQWFTWRRIPVGVLNKVPNYFLTNYCKPWVGNSQELGRYFLEPSDQNPGPMNLPSATETCGIRLELTVIIPKPVHI